MSNHFYNCVLAGLVSLARKRNDSSNQNEWTVIVLRDDPFGFEIPSKKERKALSRSQIATLNRKLTNARQMRIEMLNAAVKSVQQGIAFDTLLPEIKSKISKEYFRWIKVASGLEEFKTIMETCEALGDNCWTYGIVSEVGGVFTILTWHDDSHS